MTNKDSTANTVFYIESIEDFVNPERGFYRYSATRASAYNPLDEQTLRNYRSLHQPFSANYTIYSSLVFRYFVLDLFKDQDISSDFLSQMQADFDVARNAGVKLIPRFVYIDEANLCEGSICGPYGDAPKNIVLRHIEQIKPLLQNNKDVILSLQMGFIGIWGENYYTDYFGDASQAPLYGLTAQNWQDRNEVVAALLDALPSDRMLQVRYPQAKQKFIYGVDAPTTSAPMTASQAFSQDDIARIGIHNDCFLSSFNDIGTYIDYSNQSVSDTATLKPYLAIDSKYTITGGETCSDYNPWSNCASDGGNAEAEMSRFHYTYLNADYNNDLNNDWTGSCVEEIKRNLGYRLHLNQSTFSSEANAGSCTDFAIKIENSGYASPGNPRNVVLILRNRVTQEEYKSSLAVDPRKWYPGTHTIAESVSLPNCMRTGLYDIFLHLPDPEESLRDRVEYAIRLANMDLWDPITAYHDLKQSIEISSPLSSTSCLQVNGFRLKNNWIGSDGQWSQSPGNWSLSRIPESCDDVNIPDGISISISNGTMANGRKLILGKNAQLITTINSELILSEDQ